MEVIFQIRSYCPPHFMRVLNTCLISVINSCHQQWLNLSNNSKEVNTYCEKLTCQLATYVCLVCVFTREKIFFKFKAKIAIPSNTLSWWTSLMLLTACCVCGITLTTSQGELLLFNITIVLCSIPSSNLWLPFSLT